MTSQETTRASLGGLSRQRHHLASKKYRASVFSNKEEEWSVEHDRYCWRWFNDDKIALRQLLQ